MENNNTQKNNLKQRSYTYALSIIQYIDSLPKNDFSIQIISKQLLRSATSVGANIIEAQAGSTKRDFTNFFSHALKSANESFFWLNLLKDSKKTSSITTSQLLQETKELASMLGSSIITLRGRIKKDNTN